MMFPRGMKRAGEDQDDPATLVGGLEEAKRARSTPGDGAPIHRRARSTPVQPAAFVKQKLENVADMLKADLKEMAGEGGTGERGTRHLQVACILRRCCAHPMIVGRLLVHKYPHFHCLVLWFCGVRWGHWA